MEVGVVGAHEAVVAAVRKAGATPRTGSPGEVASADAVVATGESAISTLARHGTDAIVLPVEAGDTVRSVPGMGIGPAVEHLVAGAFETTQLPVLAATGPETTTRALFDLMLVSGEPARISEYAVFDGEREVGRFRADGVVVATPAGSRGYARAAGSPVLGPDAGVVSVIPIAPFATDADRWVLPPERLAVCVERDETPIELLADDTTAGTVVPRRRLHLGIDGHLSVAVTAESVGFYG